MKPFGGWVVRVSGTPRTDAAGGLYCSGYKFVPEEFAQKLERRVVGLERVVSVLSGVVLGLFVIMVVS